MGEQKMPNPSENQGGNQLGRRFPDENRQPKDQASIAGAAARRQSRQDPLQNRDR